MSRQDEARQIFVQDDKLLYCKESTVQVSLLICRNKATELSRTEKRSGGGRGMKPITALPDLPRLTHCL